MASILIKYFYEKKKTLNNYIVSLSLLFSRFRQMSILQSQRLSFDTEHKFLIKVRVPSKISVQFNTFQGENRVIQK